MKQILSIIIALFIFSSCKKNEDDAETCPENLSAIYGSWKSTDPSAGHNFNIVITNDNYDKDNKKIMVGEEYYDIERVCSEYLILSKKYWVLQDPNYKIVFVRN